MNREKSDKREAMKMRLLNKEIEEGLRDAYLGICPECQGSVFGELDEAKCRDCGWTNNVFNEWSAA